jgi:uncharacterized repeat protein (TIGR03803 family)
MNRIRSLTPNPKLVGLLLGLALATVATALHAQTYTVLYNFGNVKCDPLTPENTGVIAQGRDGNLYSTSPNGGCDSGGTAFKITPRGKVTVLHSFLTQTGDGAFPFSGLTLGTDGGFWGTTEAGGSDQVGTIFGMTSAGKVFDFNVFGGTNQVNGNTPIAPPVQGMDGNFYGTASEGGDISKCTYLNGGCGVIYRITPSGKYKVIHTFEQLTDGANSDSPLVLGTDGNFYGTTALGGSIGNTFVNGGVIFKITSAGKYTVLYTFCAQVNCNDGFNPYDGLVQGSDGSFYGTTSAGGLGTGGFREGVAFKITPAGKYSVLYSFCNQPGCTDGGVPYGGLVQGTDGNFYGVTVGGGSKAYGVIFQLTPSGQYTVLYNFDSTTGSYPKGTLFQATNGTLYGQTQNGGNINTGVFFSLDMKLKPYANLVAWYGIVGQTVEILGQGLTGTTAVSFNGTAASTFTVVADSYLTAVVPSGATPGTVTVTTPGGTLTSNRPFRVLPHIVTFSPMSGTVGTPVTINGTSFTGATRVTFGGVKATFTVNSDTEITTTVPTGAKTGPITVTTPDGTATSSEVFTVT